MLTLRGKLHGNIRSECSCGDTLPVCLIVFVLDSEMGMSAARLEEGVRGNLIGNRVPGGSGDAIRVQFSLEIAGGLLGDSRGIVGDGDGGDIGRHHRKRRRIS